jgi:hypothetical protein
MDCDPATWGVIESNAAKQFRPLNPLNDVHRGIVVCQVNPERTLFCLIHSQSNRWGQIVHKSNSIVLRPCSNDRSASGALFGLMIHLEICRLM